MSAPGTTGAITTSRPHIKALTVDDQHTVVESWADDPDAISLLCRAILTDPALADAARILAFNRTHPGLQATALYTLQHDRGVRDALTHTYDPDDARHLADQLHDAALDPPRCDACDRYATRTDGLCDDHGHAEDHATRVRPS